MHQYLDYLQHVLAAGVRKADRTGTGTISTFGCQMRFDLEEGFPLVTTKRVHVRSVIYELLWFLRGGTNVRYLQENGVSIWNAWADENGDLGPVYGKQWRSWQAKGGRTLDQITRVLDQIRQNPDSRRHVVSAWNVGELEEMALPPCHVLFQFYVEPPGDASAKGKLSCQLYQRSADSFLGLPFNIASYSLLTHMMAQQCDLDVGEFVWTGGDCHIYLNHVEHVEEQLARAPRALPALRLKKAASIFDYTYGDVEIAGYDPHPSIRASVAV